MIESSQSDRLVSTILTLTTYISIFMLSLVIVIVGVEVFCRYALNNPLYWSNEAALVAHIYAICFGYAAIYSSKSDIYMTFVYDRMARWPRLRRANDLLAELITLAFLLIFLAISLKLLWLQRDYIVGGMGIPYYVYYGPIALTIVLLLPCVVDDLLKAVRSKPTPPIDGL